MSGITSTKEVSHYPVLAVECCFLCTCPQNLLLELKNFEVNERVSVGFRIQLVEKAANL